MDVRVRHPAHTTVLVDREDTLDSARGTAEGLLNGIPDHALGETLVEACETRSRLVVDREDEAEVDGLPEPAAVLDESPADRRLEP